MELTQIEFHMNITILHNILYKFTMINVHSVCLHSNHSMDLSMQ